jgi:hypothetical protein
MHPLDNPIWESLASRHSPLALGRDGVLRYPAETLIFVSASAIARCTVQAFTAVLEAL